MKNWWCQHILWTGPKCWWCYYSVSLLSWLGGAIAPLAPPNPPPLPREQYLPSNHLKEWLNHAILIITLNYFRNRKQIGIRNISLDADIIYGWLLIPKSNREMKDPNSNVRYTVLLNSFLAAAGTAFSQLNIWTVFV